MKCECYSHNGFLTGRGYRAVAKGLSLEGLRPCGVCYRVDRVGSVSALVEVEEDSVYDENHIELNMEGPRSVLLQMELF